MNLTLNFIGNESGFLDENTSAFYEENNELTIIDCGFSVFNKIKKKFDFNKYRKVNIVITHLHNDHAGSLSQLILYLWFKCQIRVNIICKCKHIEKYLTITGTPPESYQIIENYEGIQFIKVEHTKYLDAYGFIANINGKKILYTGDTCTLTTFQPYMQNINELYIDLSRSGGAHINVNDVLDELKCINKKGIKIIPIHMDDELYIKNAIKSIELT